LPYHYYRRKALKVCNRVLSSLGFQLTRPNPIPQDHIPAKLYLDLIDEVQGYYSAFVSPNYHTSPERTKLLCKLLGTNISEALYIIDCLRVSAHLEGDICEFGVAQGATSALLAYEIASSTKNLWLFDSFQGLPKPTEKDVLINDISNVGSIEAYEGDMAVPVEEVQKRLREIRFPPARVKIVPGFIEETLRSSDLPNKVSFAYVDLDFYNPISVALRFLDQVLVSDGFIVVDDYGFFSAGAKAAVDEFIGTRGNRYAMLDTPKFAGHFAVLRKQPSALSR
jgi:O-methyltransferase